MKKGFILDQFQRIKSMIGWFHTLRQNIMEARALLQVTLVVNLAHLEIGNLS